MVRTGSSGYEANCIRPPGLDPGAHTARLRTANSAFSNTFEISILTPDGKELPSSAADLPPAAPELCSAEVQSAGDQRITVNRGGSLICYRRSPAPHIGASRVEVEADGAPVPVNTISSLEPGVWQVNLMLDRAVAERPCGYVSGKASGAMRVIPAIDIELRTLSPRDAPVH